MASLKPSKVQLLHDYVYTIPGTSRVVSLKAGDSFLLLNKISVNWWAVVRSFKDPEVLYVPSIYAEEAVELIGGRKDLALSPPKPPVKPKDLFGRQESPVEVAKSVPPTITDEARIELFNLLTSSQSDMLKLEQRAYLNSEDGVGENNERVEASSGGTNWKDSGVAKHKGSMQSLDMEFMDEAEISQSASHDKMSEVKDVSPFIVNTDQVVQPGRGGTCSNVPPSPPDGAVPIKTFDGGYEMHFDEESGRTFYFNGRTGERSWTLPRNLTHSLKENFAAEQIKLNSGVQSVWKEIVNERGETICLNQLSGEKWVRLYDDQGREYFFNDDTQESLWELPQFDINDEDKFDTDSSIYQFSDKAGVLYKAKLSENGKKIKKSWSASYLMLCGSMLYFYKEQKTSNNQKPNMSKPEAFLDLRSTSIHAGSNVRSSRKNLIQLITTNGTEYLLHHDDVTVIEEWVEALSKNISLLSKLMSSLKTGDCSQSLNSEVEKSSNAIESPSIQKKNKQKTLKKGEVNQLAIENAQTLSSSSSAAAAADKTKLKEKLRSWLNRRPTRDTLRDKGILKESIFGSHLLTICEKENSSVPKFVKDCIEAVEKRGLTTDGIYRLSGNMSEIQKLRFKVNQNEDYDLMDPDLDIHVVTGALKLFFRELMEPLFPFRFFKKFLDAFRISDHLAKTKAIRELVLLIPTANYETLKELFRHLVLVVKHSRENRMQAQNIAIVFGPTLMWPEESDSGSELAVSLVQRGQFIEHLLQEYNFIFTESPVA